MNGAAIVTLTLNPSLDVSWSVEAVAPNHKLRVDPDRVEPGGGGVNVSRVAQRLGQQTEAVVALGGSVGAQIGELLADGPFPVRAVPISGQSRQSVSVTERTTEAQYRFVLPGPELSQAELESTVATVLEAVGPESLLVISGSMPPGVDGSFLSRITTAVDRRKLIIDTSGPALAAALESGAYLVKPSTRELGRLVDDEPETEAEVLAVAVRVLEESSVEVLVASIGAGGAFVVTSDGDRYRLRAPTVKVRSTVGAGDSMVAGIAVSLQRTGDVLDAVSYGVAAGTAAVMTAGTELCHAEDIERLVGLVGVDRLS